MNVTALPGGIPSPEALPDNMQVGTTQKQNKTAATVPKDTVSTHERGQTGQASVASSGETLAPPRNANSLVPNKFFNTSFAIVAANMMSILAQQGEIIDIQGQNLEKRIDEQFQNLDSQLQAIDQKTESEVNKIMMDTAKNILQGFTGVAGGLAGLGATAKSIHHNKQAARAGEKTQELQKNRTDGPGDIGVNHANERSTGEVAAERATRIEVERQDAPNDIDAAARQNTNASPIRAGDGEPQSKVRAGDEKPQVANAPHTEKKATTRGVDGNPQNDAPHAQNSTIDGKKAVENEIARQKKIEQGHRQKADMAQAMANNLPQLMQSLGMILGTATTTAGTIEATRSGGEAEKFMKILDHLKDQIGQDKQNISQSMSQAASNAVEILQTLKDAAQAQARLSQSSA